MDGDSLPDNTKGKLEAIFEETYNSLSFEACDEFFRVVSKVSLLASDELLSRRRVLQDNQSQTGVTNSTDVLSPGQVVFEVCFFFSRN